MPVATDLYRLPLRTSCARVDEGMACGAPSWPKKLSPQQNTSCAAETAQVCEKSVSIATKFAGTPRSVKAGMCRCVCFGREPSEETPVAADPSSPQHQALPFVSTAQV